MTAASILASSSSSAHASTDLDDLSSSSFSSLTEDSSSHPAASAQLHDDVGADTLQDFGALAMLDEIHTINADSLALAVGILRQRQPTGTAADDADDEDGVQLSERLRDFLMVLRRRPASSSSTAGDDTAAAAASGGSHAHAVGSSSSISMASASSSSVGAAASALVGSSSNDDDDDDADDGFWAGGDDWADVRSALMSIGVNASIDEEDEEEDVWDLEAGRVKTRRYVCCVWLAWTVLPGPPASLPVCSQTVLLPPVSCRIGVLAACAVFPVCVFHSCSKACLLTVHTQS